MLTHVWIIPLIPALSFVLILAFGKKLPRKGSEIGLASVAICFVLALTVGIGWINRVNHPPEAAHGAEAVAAATHDEGGDEAATEHPEGEAAAEAEAGHAADVVPVETGHEPSIGPSSEAAEEVEATHSGVEDEEVADEPATEEVTVTEAGGHGEEETTEEEHHVTPPVQRSVTWFEAGDVTIKAGTLIDGLSALMLVVVTLISLLVHVFSTDYVGGDRRETHYFAFLSLFTAAMLFYVISDNTLQMLVGWELVGLCSFALIGHWWEEKPNSDAALKAFLTNRVGDIGLLCGVIVLYFAAGQTFDTLSINVLANETTSSHGHFLLLVSSLSLMTAVMSKSGQFILHTWLPDAMAGPTPVSALIHAATMVVAGVFLIARLYGVFFNGFSIGTSNLNVMAVIGAVTVLFGALLAFVQSDIKKVLAYSTVSQLGYMVMALGVGAWTAAIFHLFTHAIFKACLFLGSGSLAHHIHSFDMKKDMGGLRKLMPKTFWTFMIGTAALIGLFPFAGFWSKDEILAGANGLGGDGGYKLMVVMGLLGALCTAGYMTRAIYYCFFGERRGASATHDMHENGPRITVPLIILAAGAIIVGFLNIPRTGIFSGVPEGLGLRFEHYVQPSGAYFPSSEIFFRTPEFTWWIAVASTAIAGIVIFLTYSWYWKGKGPHGLTERNKVAKLGYTILENKYYLDWLYTDVIVHFVKGPFARATNWFNQHILDGIVNSVGKGAREAGGFVYNRIDQGVVDTLVNGSGMAAEGSGSILRKSQNGKVQWYAAYLFLGATILAAIFVVVAS